MQETLVYHLTSSFSLANTYLFYSDTVLLIVSSTQFAIITVFLFFCCFGFSLPGVKVKLKVTQSCLALCDPMVYTVHGILQARILEWVAMPCSRGSSQPGDQPQVSRIAGRFFTSWATREAQEYWSGSPISSPADLPDSGIELGSPALQVDSLPTELWGKPSPRGVETKSQVLKLINIASSPGASSPGAIPPRLFTSELSSSCESRCDQSLSGPLQPVSRNLGGSFPPGNMFSLLPWSWMCLQGSCSSPVPFCRACGGTAQKSPAGLVGRAGRLMNTLVKRSVWCVGSCSSGLFWIRCFSNVLCSKGMLLKLLRLLQNRCSRFGEVNSVFSFLKFWIDDLLKRYWNDVSDYFLRVSSLPQGM